MKCRRCGEEKPDVDLKYSFGFPAGYMCDKCGYDAYTDHCGLTPAGQGRVEDLYEFEYGGYDAIYGEEY